MALLTPAQRREFNRETQKKIRLEAGLVKAFKRWGRKLAKDIVENRVIDGAISFELQDELWEILRNHYVKVMDAFAKFDFKAYARGGSIGESNETKRQMILDISTKLANLILTTGNATYRKILNTTRKNILQAIENARNLLKSSRNGIVVKQDEPTQLQQVLNTAVRILRIRLASRANVIGISETQWAAESTRFISTDTSTKWINNLLVGVNDDIGNNMLGEARKKIETARALQDTSYSRAATDVINIAEDGIADGLQREKPLQVVVFKAWITRMDKKVRATHKLALGQRVRDDEPFEIGNSKLMYPRDDSLNAESKELVNCRCWVVYD